MPLAKRFQRRDMSVANLQFLTSEQSLADAATFITEYTNANPHLNGSKWISFGGSYSGIGQKTTRVESAAELDSRYERVAESLRGSLSAATRRATWRESY